MVMFRHWLHLEPIMERTADLAESFLLATEKAAIAAAKWRGRGERKLADGAAVEAMRAVFDDVPFDGRVAIGEGERDDAPMLWIGEPLGNRQGESDALSIDIAVDPLECTNHCAMDSPNAIAVLAAAPRGTLLHAPDCYMDKIAGSAALSGKLSLEADVSYNIEEASSELDKPIRDLLAVVMDRPRHEQLIRELRELDVRIRLIGDGDVSAALDAANPDSEVDLLMGIGAAPEGVITATALRGLGAHFEGKLVFRNDGHRERAETMIDGDIERIWQRDDLCMSDDSIFVASGVCSGYLPGVSFHNGQAEVHSEIIDVNNRERKLTSRSYSI